MLLSSPITVAAQTSAAGREIHRLPMHEGKLYPMYGDAGANTGPVAVLSMDPSTGFFVNELLANTEQTWRVRPLADGRALIPYIDPRGYQDPTQGAVAVGSASAGWTPVVTVTDHPPVHVFDATEDDSGAWYLFGSADVGVDGSAASAWRSTDGGVTWTHETIASSVTDGYIRAYAALNYEGQIHAWVGATIDQSQVGHYVRQSDGSWSQISVESFGEALPATLLGTPVIVGKPGQVSNVSEAMMGLELWSSVSFPSGLTTALDGWPRLVFDYVADVNGDLWLLGSDLQVWKVDHTTGLASPQFIAPDRSVCVEIDVAAGYVFFGTTDSRILRGSL